MSDAPDSSSLAAAGPAIDSSILHVLMETLPDRVYFKDRESRFVRNNLAHARWIGAASPADCAGKTDYEFFSPAHAERAYLEEQVIVRTGRPIINRLDRITRRDGAKSWGLVTKMPWCDAAGRIIGTFGLTRDITARKDAEDKLNAERALLRTIIDHLPSRIFVKDTDARYILNNRAHLEALGVAAQEDAAGKTTADFYPGPRGEQALADDRQVLAGGEAIIGQEKSDHGEGEHLHWSLTTKVPLHDLRGHITGLVGISQDITRRKRAETELQRRTDEMESDVRMARQIQQAFLPHAYPAFHRGENRDALRFAHRYIPATTLGGDFFDVLQIAPQRCGVFICDVMGHGVRAGLLTALIRGVVEEMRDHSPDPAHVLAEINRSLEPILAQTGEPIFATAFFALIDLAAGTLAYANAGHPPPFVLPPDAAAPLRLAPADPEPATGLLPGFAYTNHVCAFEPGAMFLGYTDGILEAADPAGNIFGDERLRAVLTTARGRTTDELLTQLVRDVEAYTGQSVFEDDVCLMAIAATR
ncbi:MAG: hypothetical protein RLZZ15_3817 [Verrucomicrobiota bacterium]|jgi:sigma-B regulation protein RsbU (phosphoserine phosphatase)